MTSEFQEELRRLRGLRSQTEFASAISVSRATVAAWDAGRATPSLALARKLVACGMDPHVVLDAVLSRADGAAA